MNIWIDGLSHGMHGSLSENPVNLDDKNEVEGVVNLLDEMKQLFSALATRLVISNFLFSSTISLVLCPITNFRFSIVTLQFCDGSLVINLFFFPFFQW